MAPPSHLVRRKTINIVLGCDRRFRALTALGSETLSLRHNGRQWRGLGTDRTRGQRGRARDKSKGEFQKVAAFQRLERTKVSTLAPWNAILNVTPPAAATHAVRFNVTARYIGAQLSPINIAIGNTIV